MKFYVLSEYDSSHKIRFMLKLLNSLGRGTIHNDGRLLGMYNEFQDEASPHGTSYIQTFYAEENRKTKEIGEFLGIQRYYERESADAEYQRTVYVPIDWGNFKGMLETVKKIIENLLQD